MSIIAFDIILILKKTQNMQTEKSPVICLEYVQEIAIENSFLYSSTLCSLHVLDPVLGYMSLFFLKTLPWVMGYFTEYVDYMQGKPGHLFRANEIALECGEERVATTEWASE